MYWASIIEGFWEPTDYEVAVQTNTQLCGSGSII